MPRPPKEGERREHMIGVACTPDEHETLRAAAYAARLSVAAYVRSCALQQATRPRKEKTR